MDLGHCGGTLAAITDRYAPVLRPETGTRIVWPGQESASSVIAWRRWRWASAARSSSSRSSLLSASRSTWRGDRVARPKSGSAEMISASPSIGGVGKTWLIARVRPEKHAGGTGVVVHANRLLRAQDFAPDPDECGLDRVPGLDPLDRRWRTTPLWSGQRSPVDLGVWRQRQRG